MKLKATDYPQLEDGIYPAFLLDIERREPREGSPTGKPFAGWDFLLELKDGNTAQLIAYSSLAFTPKAKARRWMQAALGRNIEPGEEIDPKEVCPLRCRVLVKLDPESGFSRIEDVLQAKKAKHDRPEGEGVEL